MFDMLPESGHRTSSWPSWGKGVAVTLHVLIVGALWRVPVTRANVSVPQPIEVFPPPPEPIPGSAVPPPPSAVECDCPVPPTLEIPDVLGMTAAPMMESPGGAPVSGPMLVASAGEVVPVTLVQDAPELLAAPTPSYPPLLRAAGVQGQVIVAAVVDTLGQAENGSVRIVRSDNRGFDAAALATVRAARFRPARMYGQAVRVLVQVPVAFRLQ